MSLGNDFLSLIDALWDVEEFNMWNPRAHSSIAYVFDRLYGSEKFSEKYSHWLMLAQTKDYNEFAWEISNATLEAYKADARISGFDVEYMEEVVASQRKLYPLKQLYVFGFVDEKYVPDWFFALFHVYMKAEEAKRDSMIMGYLTKQCDMSDKRAGEALHKLAAHFDILTEFYYFVKNRRFKKVHPITAEGLSAQSLNESTYLSPIGAYNYLIYLREEPEEALADLEQGLPKR